MQYLYGLYFGLLICNLILACKRSNFKARIFLVLLIASLVTELYAGMEGFSNYWYYLMFTPLEYVCVSIILCGHLKLRNVQLYLWMSNILFCLVCLGEIVQLKTEYPSQLTAIEDLLLIICCLISFYYTEPDEGISIIRKSAFWFSCGFFIYFMETFAVNTTYNSWLANDRAAFLIHKYANVIINIICYTFTGYGLYINRWEKKYM